MVHIEPKTSYTSMMVR